MTTSTPLTGTDSSTYCPLLWRHQAVQTTGEVIPCCRFSGPSAPQTKDTNVNDVFYSEFMDNMRSDALNSIPIDGCDKCYREELYGKPRGSMRQKSVAIFGKPTTAKLESFDISLSNECNIVCVMCHSGCSTKWREYEQQITNDFVHPLMKNTSVKYENALSDIKYMTVKGGEPFLTTEHDTLMDVLFNSTDIGNVSMTYITNGTFKPKQRITDRWSSFKNIELFLSIDGGPSANEYVRWPGKQESISKTHAYYRQLRDDGIVVFGYQSTVMIYNIDQIAYLTDGLPGGQNVLDVIGFVGGDKPITFDYIPTHLHTDMETLLRKDFDTLSERAQDRIEWVIREMRRHDCDDDKFRKFVLYTENMDRVRGTSFKLSCPNVYNVLKEDYDKIANSIIATDT